MRLVDASVFVHAFLKPKRELSRHEVEIKERAKGIVRRINEGERVAITVVQLVEVANILETYMPLESALEIEEFLLTARNVRVLGVSKRDCERALSIAREKSVGLSDAIACVVMGREGIHEIYSFDRDFDRLGVKRVCE